MTYVRCKKAASLTLQSCISLDRPLVERTHEFGDCRVENRSDVELAIVAANGPIRMAGQRIACLPIHPGFSAFRDKTMPPGMVRIEAMVGDSHRLPDPFADPFGGRTGAPAK